MLAHNLVRGEFTRLQELISSIEVVDVGTIYKREDLSIVNISPFRAYPLDEIDQMIVLPKHDRIRIQKLAERY